VGGGDGRQVAACTSAAVSNKRLPFECLLLPNQPSHQNFQRLRNNICQSLRDEAVSTPRGIAWAGEGAQHLDRVEKEYAMSTTTDPRPRQALIAWGAFMLLAVLLNGTIPFILGRDLHAWTESTTKFILFSLLIYGGIFLVVPLWLTKGWQMVRQPAFFVPVVLAILGILLWWLVNRCRRIVVRPGLSS
jgi:hypothetical protein